MYKKMLSKSLALSIALVGIGVSFQAKPANASTIEYPDLKTNHWAYESVQWGVNKGIVTGYEDGTYRPASQITEEEFVSVLARYLKDIDNKDLYGQGEDWSKPSYRALGEYRLPLNGIKGQKERKTALTRGQIARIIAAKNGFNLDERQAIYYMYENDISYGLIDGKISYESYGKDDAVDRAQIPAFFKRLEEKGHTTFKGKKSDVSGDGIKGIRGVKASTEFITDEDFGSIEEKVYPPKERPRTDMTPFEFIADKHNVELDPAREGTFGINKGKKSPISVSRIGGMHRLDIDVYEIVDNKEIAYDIIRSANKNVTDADMAEIKEIIEVIHPDVRSVKTYRLTSGMGVTPAGFYENDGGSSYRLTIVYPDKYME